MDILVNEKYDLELRSFISSDGQFSKKIFLNMYFITVHTLKIAFYLRVSSSIRWRLVLFATVSPIIKIC